MLHLTSTAALSGPSWCQAATVRRTNCTGGADTVRPASLHAIWQNWFTPC